MKIEFNLPANLIRFQFSMDLISVEDLKSIYAHFNIVVPWVKSRKAVLQCNEDIDSKFIEEMCYIAALLAHYCIFFIEQKATDVHMYRYLEFSKYISFDVDRVLNSEKYGEDDCNTDDLIDEYNLERIVPNHKELKRINREIDAFNNSIFKNSFSQITKGDKKPTAPLEETANIRQVNIPKELKNMKMLRKHLIANQMDFIPKGVVTIDAIYNMVKKEYPDLINEDFLCHMSCSSTSRKIKSPEFQHRVRSVMQSLSSRGIFTKGEVRGTWIKQ